MLRSGVNFDPKLKITRQMFLLSKGSLTYLMDAWVECSDHVPSLVIPTGGRNRSSLTMKHYYVYIMTSPSGTLYTGMTNNLQRRAYEHRNKLIEGFTKKYNVTRLVYYELFHDVRDAIAREKQIKSWRRSKKLDLIKSLNPTWRDLSEEWDD